MAMPLAQFLNGVKNTNTSREKQVNDKELNLEPIKSRLQEISRAPWAYFGIEDVSGGMIYDQQVAVAQIHWDNEPTEPIRPTVPERQADRNGYFIANAPTDIQALLEEVERLRSLIKGETKC